MFLAPLCRYGKAKCAERVMYFCIDLKSFYASVECVERGLDPMTTRLVVADPERSEKTICLAVSPAMKALGIRNRCRVFEIPKHVEYIMAPPRMKLYIEYAANIYGIYLKYVSKEDIHVYSIDEAFLDVTHYLQMYEMSAGELARKIMEEIRQSIGVVATCGIGTNLYLAKIALDITAKHASDFVGYLDEKLYLETLWEHRPITDFWRVGPGISRRLASVGLLTMGDVAHADEELLYRLFGIDAELLIDHAWGRESTTIADIHHYAPQSSSIGSGQVLMRDYAFEEGQLVAKEMADLLCLELVARHLVTGSITLHVGYSNEVDMKSAHGSVSISVPTNSNRVIVAQVAGLYERIVRRSVPVRRMTITFNDVVDEAYEQYDLFTAPQEREKDRKLQMAALEIKKKFGKNAILKGMDLEAGATTRERNRQIGGHKSGE